MNNQRNKSVGRRGTLFHLEEDQFMDHSKIKLKVMGTIKVSLQAMDLAVTITLEEIMASKLFLSLTQMVQIYF